MPKVHISAFCGLSMINQKTKLIQRRSANVVYDTEEEEEEEYVVIHGT